MSSSRRRPVRGAVIVAMCLLLTLLPAVPSAARGPGDKAGAKVVERGRTTVARAVREAREHPRKTVDRTDRLAPRFKLPRDERASDPSSGLAPRPAIGEPVDPAVVGPWQGIDQEAAGGVEPPDPWIAVNATHVVQVTNVMIHISDRTGRLLQSVPTWALFGLTPAEIDADPRILWDAAHGRWVGVLLSFVPGAEGIDAGYLNLAVSASSDPTGAWDSYGFTDSDEFGNPALPDYPGIASSGDKVVVASNEFDYTLKTYLGTSVLVIPWSTILDGSPAPSRWTYGDPTLWRVRPAQVLAASNDVHLVAMDSSDGRAMYQKVTGTGSGFSDGAWQDLTTLTGVDLFGEPPAPRQPGSPATIVKAVQAGPTDAVWRANRLWFVATDWSTFDGGTTYVDSVRVSQLDTSVATPSELQTAYLEADGFDRYLGGIGVSGDGTAFVPFTESSPSQFTTSRFAIFTSAYGWSEPVTIVEGEATYPGTRWGDYVGVAADPTATATVWQANQVTRADGTWGTTVSRLVFDLVAPVVTAPKQAFVVPSTLATTFPVRISWTATEAGSGIDHFEVDEDRAGIGFETINSTAVATSVVRTELWTSACSGWTYQYQVRGIDGFGNEGPSALWPTWCPLLKQTSSGVSYSSGWKTASSSKYSGGSTRYASLKGKTASFKVTARNVAIVAAKAKSRGSFKVYVDGVYKGTVKTYSSTTKYRQIVWQYGWSSVGTHTIKIVVSGTSGHPTVDLDGILTLQ